MPISSKIETNAASSFRWWLWLLHSTKSKSSNCAKEKRQLFQSDSIKRTLWHYQHSVSLIGRQRNSNARNLEPDKFAVILNLLRWKSDEVRACSSNSKRIIITDYFLRKALVTNDCIYRECISTRNYVKYWKWNARKKSF